MSAESGGRRSPQQTKDEILDAARRMLWERPFRDLTVADLMEGTSVGRSSFYLHFEDRYALAAALLDGIDEELRQATSAARHAGMEPTALRGALEGVVRIWARHGPVLGAISEASAQDERLEGLYRRDFVQRIIDRVVEGIDLGRSEGRVVLDVDATEVGTLLVLMSERYLCDRFGRLPQRDPVAPTAAMVVAWERVLGLDPA